MYTQPNGKHCKTRKTKVNLVFSEEKRREFLTGFHKRKLQRKKKAKEKIEQDLKEEKKRLRAEAKESYKKLVKSHTPIPEVEDLLVDEYEDDEVNVKVIELSTNEIAKQNNWIGANQPNYESDIETSESENVNVEEEEIPGMELKLHAKPHEVKIKQNVKEEPISKMEIKKILKKQATRNVQNSKAFQLKNKIEKQRQKKKALQKKKFRIKLQNKAANKRSNKWKKS